MSLDSFLKALVMFAVKDRTGKISPQKYVCMHVFLFIFFVLFFACMPENAISRCS